APLKARSCLRFDDLLDDAGNLGDRVGVRGLRQVQVERGTTLLHAPRVADPAPEKIRVGDDHLFAVHAADARGLEPDLLDVALDALDGDRIPDDEWTVQHNGDGCKQVAQD